MDVQRFNVWVQYTKDLDEKYQAGDERYNEVLLNVKAAGFKVFRNSEGKHRLQVAYPEMTGDFKDLFGDLFGGF